MKTLQDNESEMIDRAIADTEESEAAIFNTTRSPEQRDTDDDGRITREEWRSLALTRYAAMERYRAQRDELLAALKRIDRRIHGSDGSNLPACRIVESIDEIVGEAIAKCS